jgi:hypothetical protein
MFQIRSDPLHFSFMNSKIRNRYGNGHGTVFVLRQDPRILTLIQIQILNE